MKLLVLGGTRFVGRAIVDAALARRHDVTLFNRGSDRDLFPEVPRITGDRNTRDIERIAQTDWDAVLDVSAYHPSQVRTVVTALAGRETHHVFISTVSVYADPVPRGGDESAPLLHVDESIPREAPHSYGGLKVLCEQVMRDAAESRLTVVRPTVVIGPHDPTERFTWWLRRIAQGGELDVPRRLEQPQQLIDSEDLAEFVVLCAERRLHGTFNATGPTEPLTLRSMITTLAEVTGADVRLREVDSDAFPLCLGADAGRDGVFTLSSRAALDAGLRLRPLRDSALAVLRADVLSSDAAVR